MITICQPPKDSCLTCTHSSTTQAGNPEECIALCNLHNDSPINIFAMCDDYEKTDAQNPQTENT